MDHNPPRSLSKEAVDDFKRIYKEEFGEDINDDEASEIALRLLRFVHILEYGKNPSPGR
jgi:hypothetical protein